MNNKNERWMHTRGMEIMMDDLNEKEKSEK